MIKITQGDTANLVLTATNAAGAPINLTGATLETRVRGVDGNPIIYPNSQHTINPDQVNDTGQFTLALSASDTAAIPTGDNKEIITEVTNSPNITFFHGKNALTVLSAIPGK